MLFPVNAAALLRRARRRAGMSQRILAQAAGVPQSTVARIELAQLSPRVDTFERLLRATGQTLSSERVLGIGVDRSQIRELLRLTPGERLRLGERDARNLAAFDAAVRR